MRHTNQMRKYSFKVTLMGGSSDIQMDMPNDEVLTMKS